MTNKSRQPVTQKAYPGSQRYADSTANSVAGQTQRVETVTVNMDSVKEPKITQNGDLPIDD